MIRFSFILASCLLLLNSAECVQETAAPDSSENPLGELSERLKAFKLSLDKLCECTPKKEDVSSHQDVKNLVSNTLKEIRQKSLEDDDQDLGLRRRDRRPQLAVRRTNVDQLQPERDDDVLKTDKRRSNTIGNIAKVAGKVIGNILNDDQPSPIHKVDSDEDDQFLGQKEKEVIKNDHRIPIEIGSKVLPHLINIFNEKKGKESEISASTLESLRRGFVNLDDTSNRKDDFIPGTSIPRESPAADTHHAKSHDQDVINSPPISAPGALINLIEKNKDEKSKISEANSIPTLNSFQPSLRSRFLDIDDISNTKENLADKGYQGPVIRINTSNGNARLAAQELKSYANQPLSKTIREISYEKINNFISSLVDRLQKDKKVVLFNIISSQL